MSNAIEFPDVESALQASGVGSIFERVPHGWKVKFVDGGTSIFVEGATIRSALASHGTQIEHPVKEIPQGIVEIAAVEEVVVIASSDVGSVESVLTSAFILGEDDE